MQTGWIHANYTSSQVLLIYPTTTTAFIDSKHLSSGHHKHLILFFSNIFSLSFRTCFAVYMKS